MGLFQKLAKWKNSLIQREDPIYEIEDWNEIVYDRDDLQDRLNLFRFIYTNRGISMDDKVKKFLRMAVLTRKVIRFRAVFAKKTEK